MVTAKEIYETSAAKRRQAQIDKRATRTLLKRHRENIKSVIEKTNSRLLIKGKKPKASRLLNCHKRKKSEYFRKSTIRLRAPGIKAKRYGFI